MTQETCSLGGILTLGLGIPKGSLLDFETTGRPQKDTEHEVIALGYFDGNQIVVVQRRTSEKDLFYRDLVTRIGLLPKPFYSYNASFEQEIMRTELGIKTDGDEITDFMEPWKAKAEGKGVKWPKLDDLISEPSEYFGEQAIHNEDVPKLWKEYLSSGNPWILDSIMSHCLSDVLRELILLIGYPALEGDKGQPHLPPSNSESLNLW